MLATGMRVGEASAVTWDAIDLDTGTVEVRGTVSRIKGRGLVVAKPKSDARVRTLALPEWCVEMLRKRSRSRTVFPAPQGGLRGPGEHSGLYGRRSRLPECRG
jgi:integrase